MLIFMARSSLIQCSLLLTTTSYVPPVSYRSTKTFQIKASVDRALHIDNTDTRGYECDPVNCPVDCWDWFKQPRKKKKKIVKNRWMDIGIRLGVSWTCE